MGVQFEWQQDLDDDGWSRRQEGKSPDRRLRKTARWLLLVLLLATAAGSLALWRLNRAGLEAAKADVQEAVQLGHWALQQGNQDVFRRSLDPLDTAWQARVLGDWPALTAAAQGAEAPTVETARLLGDTAEATLRWRDAGAGQSYLARRWFRLVDSGWRWARPRPDTWGDKQRQERPHLTLTLAAGEGAIAAPILDTLDGFAAALCQRYGVGDNACRFHVSWELLADDGLPPELRDLELPSLASVTADELDGPLYLMGAVSATWRSYELRQRLRRFTSGDSFLATWRLETLRPPGNDKLPDALPGEPDRPIILPSPWLLGIDEAGRAHPLWQAHAERLLADAVLRRAEGVVLGNAKHVNAAWALHQALLAGEAGPPVLESLAPAGPAAPHPMTPLQVPDLSSLGAALQSSPDELALAQLADLVRYLRERWSAEQLAALPRGLGRSAFTSRWISATLGIDQAAFLADWRAEQLAQPGSPLAGLAEALVEQARRDVQLRRGDQATYLRLYASAARSWRFGRDTSLLYGSLSFDAAWGAKIKAIGAIEDIVWADMEEWNGQQRWADLRFFRQDPAQGWLREAPDARFWGAERTLTTDRVRWRYRQADEASVLAVAPLVDGYVHQLAVDFALPAQPLTVTVLADTLSRSDAEPANSLEVPSPRAYRLDLSNGSASEALRQNVALQLVVQHMLRKAQALGAGQALVESGPIWPVLLAAVRSELRQLDTPSEELFRGQYDSLARAVAAGQAPAARQILAADPGDDESPESRASALLAGYVLDVHGWQLFDSLLADGLQTTLEAAMATRHWSWDELELDWQRYLQQQFAEGAAR